MVVGVPSEIKPEENRTAIVPGGVETLVNKGHHVIIEKGAAKKNAALAKGINLVEGTITHQAVAEAFNLPYTPLEDII